MRRIFRTIKIFILLILLGGVSFYVYVKHQVSQAVEPYIYSSYDSVPANQVGLVLGATVYPAEDQPSPVLAKRLDGAIDLFQKGKVQQLLLSGDGRTSDYNEISVMKDYATAASIPASDLLEDPQGLRTYDSCYRAKSVFHLSAVTVVTQPEHLRRTIYTCRALGVNAVGVVSPSTGGTNNMEYFLHEQAAIVLAWVDVHILHPQPNGGSNG